MQVEEPGQGLSRRSFLNIFSAGSACGLALSGAASAASHAAAQDVEPQAMLVDTTRCTYCNDCVEACYHVHERTYTADHYMRLTLVRHRDESRARLSVPMRCLQCKDAPCAAVCQGKALTQTAMGPVVSDPDKCIGCLACMNACAFSGTLFFDRSEHHVFKCDMCYDRLAQGERPACVEACHLREFDALVSGTPAEIEALGKERAEATGGVLLYPEQTNVWFLVAADDLEKAEFQNLFGFRATYPMPARVKEKATKWSRLGWIPVLAGVGVGVGRWRKNSSDDLIKVREEE